MARKSLLKATKLTLDYDSDEDILRLIKGKIKNQISRIEPQNRREKEVFGRKYCPRQAYNLAISLIKEMEKGNYIGDFEITSNALSQLRDYETDYMKIYNQNKPKPAFEISALKDLE